MSPLYWSGWCYGAGMRFTHGRSDLKQRYEYIAGLSMGKVLDVGCGSGVLANYLSSADSYFGIDLNERLLGSARKHGRNVSRQDVMEFDRFSEFDVCVIMDVLHHISPRHEQLLERALRGVSERVIICEPFEICGKFAGNRYVKKLAGMLDDDGNNNCPDVWFEKEALYEFYDKYNPVEITEIGKAVIAVYEK